MVLSNKEVKIETCFASKTKKLGHKINVEQLYMLDQAGPIKGQNKFEI